MRKLFSMVAGFCLTLSSCGLLTTGSDLDILANDGKIYTINMAPRHYRVRDYCVDIVNKATPNLLGSLTSLTAEQRGLLPWPARLASYHASDCAFFHKRGAMIRDYDTIFADHSGKIGIILPPSAQNEGALQIILNQIRTTLSDRGLDPNEAMIIRRVEKSPQAALAAAATLIHMDRVALLVAINSTQAQAMQKLADPTQVPMMFVSPNVSHSVTAQTMRIYPPVKRLAKKLTDAFLAQGVHHASLFYPRGSNLELFDAIRREAGRNIDFMEASYDPSSSTNILDTVKRVGIRIGGQGETHGVLILDNFKMVRHLVNILKSAAPSTKFLFAGNQQWRSPALVTPPEEALEGAVFVDFIGNYTDLPRGIDAPVTDSPFFTTAQAASRIDYQIIGHRVGSLAAEALRGGYSRQRIAKALQSMHNHWDRYFPSDEYTFDASRDSTWPAYLFTVHGESIVPL